MAAWDIKGRDAFASTSGIGSTLFDTSGWNVNFGGGSITSERRQTSVPAAAAGLDEWLPYAGIAAAVLIAWRLTRRKK